jgi:hypothetical protein
MKAFRLIDATSKELFIEWEEDLPSILTLPNGDHVCGARPGDTLGQYKIEEFQKPERPKPPTLEERVAALEALIGRAGIAIKS